MRIRLLVDLPVSEEHGMTEGREFDVLRQGERDRDRPLWFVMGDAGEEVGVYGREAEVVSLGDIDGED